MAVILGEVVTTVWRTIAFELDEVPQPDQVGTLRMELQVYFAWSDEAANWAYEQQQLGYETSMSSAATSYFGETDSHGNCWSVRAEKVVQLKTLTGCAGVYGTDWVYA